MKIAQRYLDEIEQICEGEGEKISCRVLRHWDYPTVYGGLFAKCGPDGSGPCGCLTQIRSGGGWQAIRGIAESFPDLTDNIHTDTRLASNKFAILPEHLRGEIYFLTDSQKQEVRECLYPYAEWQTRLRLEFQDVPGIEGEIVEVGA